MVVTKVKPDRDSIDYAKQQFEKFLPDDVVRQKVTKFLSHAIEIANELNPKNWSLNIDIKGSFIKFNVGQEYCIRISKSTILILCDRNTLDKEDIKDIPVLFRGYLGEDKIESFDITKVNDCLVKVKGSIGCLLKIPENVNDINAFKQSNLDFLREAIATTKILPKMQNAHSIGAMEYLFGNLQTIEENSTDFFKYEYEKIERARRISPKERKKRLPQSGTKPKQKIVLQTVFIRNEYVAAEVLERAAGFCEKCHSKAPFIRDSNGTPYLEIHHKIQLAENGDDTVDNTIALCPNCHRHAHQGKNSY